MGEADRAVLHGQVALVTGASSGLGARFAEVLAAAGASVAISARRTDRLAEVGHRIEAAGGRFLAVPLDVTQPATFVPVLDRIEDDLGPLSILVNNAGVTDAAYAVRMDLDLINRVLDTNVRAPFMLSSELARRLIQRKAPGRIVNISGIGAYSYSSASAASLYSTSKAAVARMTEVLALEWAKFGINVNAIAPGLIRSEMTEGMLARVGDVSKHFPRQRIGDPSVLDSTLLYLVSPTSAYVTGVVIKVDDGQTPR
jgi:NAD(P)-dependent dehydrogenase (short-subunit alcohol dehydrogenase family)